MMTTEQRKQVLAYICERSPAGEPFTLSCPQYMFGLDFGWAVLYLAVEGKCGCEDPDMAWSTPRGRAELQRLKLEGAAA